MEGGSCFILFCSSWCDLLNLREPCLPKSRSLTLQYFGPRGDVSAKDLVGFPSSKVSMEGSNKEESDKEGKITLLPHASSASCLGIISNARARLKGREQKEGGKRERDETKGGDRGTDEDAATTGNVTIRPLFLSQIWSDESQVYMEEEDRDGDFCFLSFSMQVRASTCIWGSFRPLSNSLEVIKPSYGVAERNGLHYRLKFPIQKSQHKAQDHLFTVRSIGKHRLTTC